MRLGWVSSSASMVALCATSAHAGGASECIDAATKGQDLRDEGHLVRARQELRKCADKGCPAQIRSDCTGWLAEIDKRVPSLVFRAVGPNGDDVLDATVKIDGAVVSSRLDGFPVDVDPGPHVLRFERPGYEPVEKNISVLQGEKARNVVVKLVAVAPVSAPPKPRAESGETRPIPVASFIGWGVGGVGLLAFAGFGLKANLDYSHLKSTCSPTCPADDRSSLKTTMVIADVALVIGLVGAGVGTVLYLLRPSAQTEKLARAAW